MPPDLSGQRILIIGGGSRMGLATARLTAAHGAEVILSSRTASRLQSAAESITSKVSVHAANASVAAEAALLLRAAAPLDHIVVTASSGDVSAGGVPDTPPEMAQAAFQRFWTSYHTLHFAPRIYGPTVPLPCSPGAPVLHFSQIRTIRRSKSCVFHRSSVVSSVSGAGQIAMITLLQGWCTFVPFATALG